MPNVPQSKPSGGEVGIDMGIARFATLSNGQFFKPINAFKMLKGKLAKLQKQLKNKTKFSKNWRKLQAKISKVHNKIANIRKAAHYLHQISHYISKAAHHAIVYVEDLKVKNMSKRAVGTNVATKSGLNRAILDQDEVWFEFRRQLDYKLLCSGGYLIAVNPKNTSRCCPVCGHTARENRRSQAHFECVKCSYINNADLVGAINILRRGQDYLSSQK